MSTPAAPAPAPGGNAPGPEAEEQGGVRRFMGIAQQIFMFWAISQLATRFFAPKAAVTPDATTMSTQPPGTTNTETIDPWSLPPKQATSAWPLGDALSMHVYLTTSPRPDLANLKEGGLPHFVWDGLTYGDYKDTRSVEYNVDFPESVKHNGSLYADIFLLRNGASLDRSSPSFKPDDIHFIRKLLTPYLPREKVRKAKNLLSQGASIGDEEEEEEADVLMPHWHSNITLALVSDASPVPYASLPPPILEHVHLINGVRDATGTIGSYKPILFPNEFWHLRSHYVEVNTSTTVLPVTFTFQPMSYMKFQLFASMTHGFKEAAKQQGGAGVAEMDEIKRMLLETNPWFLGLTGLVSMLHVVFEMLAFKSDVSHWREKKEMVGVSVRTIVTNVFVQIVVLLYLIDNNDNTSWMILFGSGMGVLIEAWKITKAVDISIVPSTGTLLPYKIDIKDKHVLSEDEKKTQEYDKLAFRYVSYAAIPLLAGYTVYSLVYESHRGWYSFIISTLTSFVYMFGFAQLVPQLIINYKLKSVAHMPMKAMIYKSLSTVVDDLFAFCIKMPFLHRLACFRDDVVFVIFLYQRWIYRIDPKRVNEYGQVMAQDADKAGETESKKKR
ncbi:cleft lip and palate associated transmembrane protein [Mucidula mucida]|nr:cleft lip and palate associated transmembrane protein [Mucidula mucida]